MKPVQEIYPTLSDAAKRAPLTVETRNRMLELGWQDRAQILDDLVHFLFQRRCNVDGIRTAVTLALEAVEAPRKISSMHQAVCFFSSRHTAWSVPALKFMQRTLVSREAPMKWRKLHPGLSRLMSEMAAG